MIAINEVEVATRLAHNRTLEESRDICANEDEMYEYHNPEGAYIPEIQKRFNDWYDYYFNILWTMQVYTEVPKEIVS